MPASGGQPLLATQSTSERCAGELNVEAVLGRTDFRHLLDNNADFFQLVDKKILHSLVDALHNKAHTCAEIRKWTRSRRNTHWYPAYQAAYSAVEHAATLRELCDKGSFVMESIGDAVLRYASTWYQVDQGYRKFLEQVQESRLERLFRELVDDITARYANTYVRALGDAFQRQVDAVESWQSGIVKRQDRFFDTYVRPVLDKNKKMCVILSDALRYEAGEELARNLNREAQLSAEISPLLAMLPSYTQLGMAALLPHKELTIAENDTGMVYVDDQNAQGTDRRGKILQAGVKGKRACACTYEHIQALNKDQCSALIRENDLLYIYHNTIDATGDNVTTEGKVCLAVTAALGELVQLLKKLAASHVSTFVVTSDHGFLYQNQAMEESDFADEAPEGELVYRTRRFALGTHLARKPGLRFFTAAQLGLSGTLEALFPKSVTLLRRSGAGSRYVHGGTSLQEVVLPVVRVTKKRGSDRSPVDVEILGTGNRVITVSFLLVTLYQKQPVSEKNVGRELRVGLYDSAGTCISDVKTFIFDSASPNASEREQECRLDLGSAATALNNQNVELRLYDRIRQTTQYQDEPYKVIVYTLRRSFTRDFDF